MRVALIGLIAGGHSGVPRYAATLIGAIGRVAGEAAPGLDLVAVTTPSGAAAIAGAEGLELEVVRGRLASAGGGPKRVLAEQFAARAVRADLLHFFDLSAPALAPRRPFVTTVHDASVPLGYERTAIPYKRVLQPYAARRARAVVAISAFAGEEAVRAFGAEPSKIRVVHSGPGLGGAPPEAAAPAPAAGAPPYLLYVGNFADHKNLPFLIRAFAAVGGDARLLLVGRERSGGGAVSEALAASPARDRIEIRSDVPDAELEALYRGAAALVLPSRYEGFGFTALEAMARGCPVVSSDIPALQEVSGDGALVAPLDDEPAWTDALRRVLGDPGLRDELRERGRATVARYSWDATARGVLDVLQDAQPSSSRRRLSPR